MYFKAGFPPLKMSTYAACVHSFNPFCSQSLKRTIPSTADPNTDSVIKLNYSLMIKGPVKEHVAVLVLLAVLAVHHPDLPANFILQLRQQQRVCVAHRRTLLQPWSDGEPYCKEMVAFLVSLAPPSVVFIYTHRQSEVSSTFEQTLSDLLCFITHACAVHEVER